uniref:uncharacterized protein LOC124073898 n=1 Tax=Scatophagus argus TaxID=75038 RepID=UPI001ED7FEC1|nr:uncharacterized protein LOC124073898 [Scatophagus argus]
MIMSFYPGIRTRHVHGWISIIWFTSAVSIAVTEEVKLQTISQVVSQCGTNVSLPCDVASSQQLDIIKFSWVGRNITCLHDSPQSEPGVLCEKKSKSPHDTLTLTLLNVMPVNQGSYVCKLHSKQTVKYAATVVTVQNCSGSFSASINASRAECWFSGLYPSGHIHWFQEDVNLTDFASTGEEEDQYGRYNVSSTINIEKRNLSQPFKCSLWIPSLRSYVHTLVPPIAKPLETSGSVVKQQWIFVMVGIMMVKLMT